MKDVVANFLTALRAGDTTLKAANCAFIVLLPKKHAALAAGDFRPVSLQNCTPKIASKIHTSRLQPFITDLVSPLQTGFIRGRNITDNFLFALELV
jgi:hypothetical protein